MNLSRGSNTASNRIGEFFRLQTLPWLQRNTRQPLRYRFRVMGTTGEITVFDNHPFRARKAIRAAVIELRHIESLLSRFSATSDVGRVNLSTPNEPVVVNRLTADIMQKALAWAEWSNGRFDPCVGEAVRLWDVGQREIPPALRAVNLLADRQLYKAIEVEIGADQAILQRNNLDVKIDLGGIAKGFGVDRAVSVLRKHGVRQGLVNVGGDLYAMGCSQGQKPWRLGIRSSHNPSLLNGVIELEDSAMASSGDYYQFFEYSGKRYHHILDPKTAEPIESPIHSVTIIANDCTTADAAATAVFGIAHAEAEIILRSRPGNPRIIKCTFD